jgi:hypothetical protein
MNPDALIQLVDKWVTARTLNLPGSFHVGFFFPVSENCWLASRWYPFYPLLVQRKLGSSFRKSATHSIVTTGVIALQMATSAVAVVAANKNVRLALNPLLSPGLVKTKTRLTASDISFSTTTVAERWNLDGASETAMRRTNPLVTPPGTTTLTSVSAPKPTPITVQLQPW